MFRKIPIVATPILFDDLRSAFTKFAESKLRALMSEYTGTQYVYFTGSGTGALYLILTAVSEQDERDEVIIPAYTASSIVFAIQKAGLKPVLCDISLEDFNLDMDFAVRRINKRTLAVIGVHMFGIVNQGLREFKAGFPGIFTLEDCCQAFGSKQDQKSVGSLGDISFFSFNRGKNLPLYGGGMIATNNIKLAGSLEKTMSLLEVNTFKEKLGLFAKLTGLSFVVKPQVYGLLTPLLRQLKEQAPLRDFSLKHFTGFQSGTALALLKHMDEYGRQRYHNAQLIINALKDKKDVQVPYIYGHTQPAFNRLPLIFKDIKTRDKTAAKLRRCGIETSRMYYKPLHKLYDLGHKSGEFPNAEYLAEHLLCVPVHPLMELFDIDRMINILIKN